MTPSTLVDGFFRKVRCDGKQPACTGCLGLEQDCHYSSEVDGRKYGAATRTAAAAARRASRTDVTDNDALARRNAVLNKRVGNSSAFKNTFILIWKTIFD